jgi:hypothetical protein
MISEIFKQVFQAVLGHGVAGVVGAIIGVLLLAPLGFLFEGDCHMEFGQQVCTDEATLQILALGVFGLLVGAAAGAQFAEWLEKR